MKRILMIEDDTDLREGLGFSLEMEGYTVSGAETACGGAELLNNKNFDLIILDCNLPDGNGFDFCRELRRHSSIPVFMLTARDSEMDEVKALELGVDDYMSKPFSLAVLKARIKKLLFKDQALQFVESNGISIDKNRCSVSSDGKEIPCSRIEYKLLLNFFENKNQVLSKEQILERVWDPDGKYVDENTVSVNIRRLRTKIEKDPAHPEWLKTVHGIGYMWKEE